MKAEAERLWLATKQDRGAQAESRDAEQFIEIRKQDKGLHILGTSRRRDRPKLDLSERGAQERVAHGRVPKGMHLGMPPSLVA